MRKIIGSVFQSLEGVIQGPGRPEEDRAGGFALGGWVGAYTDDATSAAVIETLLGAPYALLLGRKTYEIFAAYWPYQAAGNPIADRFNGADKYVLTRGQDSLDWARSHRLESLEAVRALKATAGPDLLIQGSSTLYPQLLGAGLIDRVRVQTFPLVLGGGKRLFGEALPPAALKLVSSTVSTTGVVIATYEPTGEALRLSPEPPDPSAAERARWERVSREG